jgi:uncharacterized protein
MTKKLAKEFWKHKSLEQMTTSEWESLCDGCARCCLNKYEDEDTLEIYYTDVACKLLDTKTCRCSDYKNRRTYVKDCIVLTPKVLPEMNCLPPTCAYRLLYEGKPLYDWHPLISGDPASVHKAGISVKDRVVSEVGLSEDEIASRLVTWPLRKSVRKQRTRR